MTRKIKPSLQRVLTHQYCDSQASKQEAAPPAKLEAGHRQADNSDGSRCRVIPMRIIGSTTNVLNHGPFSSHGESHP